MTTPSHPIGGSTGAEPKSAKHYEVLIRVLKQQARDALAEARAAKTEVRELQARAVQGSSELQSALAQLDYLTVDAREAAATIEYLHDRRAEAEAKARQGKQAVLASAMPEADFRGRLADILREPDATMREGLVEVLCRIIFVREPAWASK